jgi:hypothetical protein
MRTVLATIAILPVNAATAAEPLPHVKGSGGSSSGTRGRSSQNKPMKF